MVIPELVEGPTRGDQTAARLNPGSGDARQSPRQADFDKAVLVADGCDEPRGIGDGAGFRDSLEFLAMRRQCDGADIGVAELKAWLAR